MEKKKSLSCPGRGVFFSDDVSRALVTEKITQIGLNFAEIRLPSVTLIKTAVAYDFTVLESTFFGRKLKEPIFFKINIFIRNDSDSFITLTIM